MKLKITRKGVFDGPKELPVGHVVETKGETIPASLLNKCIDLGAEDTQADAVDPVGPTPASAAERQTLLKTVAISLPDDDFNKDGKPKLSAVNAEVEEKFDAEEIATLWAGISGTVEAERAAKVGS